MVMTVKDNKLSFLIVSNTVVMLQLTNLVFFFDTAAVTRHLHIIFTHQWALLIVTANYFLTV